MTQDERSPRTGLDDDPRPPEYEANSAVVEDGADPEAVRSRAALLPEEQAVGSDDPQAQAQVILEESLQRTEVPGAAPDTHLEQRRSADTA